MEWNIEMVDEYVSWFKSLDQDIQDSIFVSIRLLEEHGPSLPRPHSDTLYGSKVSNLKELRTQHKGKPFRSLYAFDPERSAILLIGGDKSSDKKWYERHIPVAEKRFELHLKVKK